MKKISSLDLQKLQSIIGYDRNDFCSLLGLSVKRYYELCSENPKESLSDDNIIRALILYTNYPQSLPQNDNFDPKEFYTWLGFGKVTEDYKRFARLVGRHPDSIKISVGSGKHFNKSLTNYLKGFHRLGLNPQSTLDIMEKIVSMADAQHTSEK